MLYVLQFLGDFVSQFVPESLLGLWLRPQTPYWGFAPGPHWGTSVPQTPILNPQLAKPAYAPAKTTKVVTQVVQNAYLRVRRSWSRVVTKARSRETLLREGYAVVCTGRLGSEGWSAHLLRRAGSTRRRRAPRSPAMPSRSRWSRRPQRRPPSVLVAPTRSLLRPTSRLSLGSRTARLRNNRLKIEVEVEDRIFV